MFAPIIVFAYNRPQHLEQVLSALAANPESSKSDLYIYIDGPKADEDRQKNERVGAVAESFRNGFFRTVTIEKSLINKGLASSVISGVTKVIGKYGRVIVTEDDSVCSPFYLHFMNEALGYYEKEKDIWAIGGYSVPLQVPPYYDKDVIKLQRCSSYAWGTWKDRWEKVDWEVPDYHRFLHNPFARYRFNRWGNDRSLMLDAQMLGLISSWAIRFEYSMVKHRMYSIMPVCSYINTIGHDGSGTHSHVDSSKKDKFAIDLAKALPEFRLENVKLDNQIRLAYNRFFDMSLAGRVSRYLRFFLLRHKKLHYCLRALRAKNEDKSEGRT